MMSRGNYSLGIGANVATQLAGKRLEGERDGEGLESALTFSRCAATVALTSSKFVTFMASVP